MNKCLDCGVVFSEDNPLRVDAFGQFVCAKCRDKMHNKIKQMRQKTPV